MSGCVCVCTSSVGYSFVLVIAYFLSASRDHVFFVTCGWMTEAEGGIDRALTHKVISPVLVLMRVAVF